MLHLGGDSWACLTSLPHVFPRDYSMINCLLMNLASALSTDKQTQKSQDGVSAGGGVE